jgi:hypothetical protein
MFSNTLKLIDNIWKGSQGSLLFKRTCTCFLLWWSIIPKTRVTIPSRNPEMVVEITMTFQSLLLEEPTMHHQNNQFGIKQTNRIQFYLIHGIWIPYYDHNCQTWIIILIDSIGDIEIRNNREARCSNPFNINIQSWVEVI